MKENMTDSGFSSAASSRSVCSIIKPSLINVMSDSKPVRNILGTISSNIPKSENGNLPKPVLQNCKLGRPIIPNRLLYGKNSGGYSPIGSPLFSFNESGLAASMSPMSSLAMDFCELNTSQDSGCTPRRRLSLSSVSSNDSPHPNFNISKPILGLNSPLSSSINNAYNSHVSSSNECSTPMLKNLNEPDKENVFFQNRPKSSKIQRFRSMPVGRKLGTSAVDEECKPRDIFSPIFPVVQSKSKSTKISPCRPSPLKLVRSSEKKPLKLVLSPNKKRLLDDTTSSAFCQARKRSKCSISLSAKSAFHKERKTKSADAILKRPVPVIASSPISKVSSLSRSMSAPPQTIPDDDDIVLSHSSLCSGESDDESGGMSALQGSSHSSDLFIEALAMCAASTSPAKDAPSGLDCLIRGKLLFANSSNNNESGGDSILMDSSLTSSNVDLKPRELFRSPSAPPLTSTKRSLLLKRPSRPSPTKSRETPVSYKRRKSVADFGSIAAMEEDKENNEAAAAVSFLNRSRSASDFEIMRAVEQGCSNNDLVGDFSRECRIKTVRGHHQDLKYISCETMVEILTNKDFDVDVVDCRYTYEYEGGHIRGADNIWTERQMQEQYFQRGTIDQKRKTVIVFHCEFSSERAPKMARALRNFDRSVNNYPKLHYPEIYILHSGYKSFYQTCKDYCEPRSYVPMLDKNFESELRKFRVKSKTWAGEKSKAGLMKRLQHHR